MTDDEPLDAAGIRASLDPGTRAALGPIAVHRTLGSTNSHLLAAAERGAASGSVCIAERQTAGRGRLGRGWIAEPGASLLLSLLWRFPEPPAALGAASLAAGVAAARAISHLGVAGLGLKWPNDLLWRERKLAGILCECAVGSGASVVVVGIGVNLAVNQDAVIDQPWVNLAETLPDTAVMPSRNQLAAVLLTELASSMRAFALHGMQASAVDWQRFDAAVDRSVTVHLADTRVAGTGRGVDATGALLVATEDGIRRFVAGEVSLRLNS